MRTRGSGLRVGSSVRWRIEAGGLRRLAMSAGAGAPRHGRVLEAFELPFDVPDALACLEKPQKFDGLLGLGTAS